MVLADDNIFREERSILWMTAERDCPNGIDDSSLGCALGIYAGAEFYDAKPQEETLRVSVPACIRSEQQIRYLLLWNADIRLPYN